MAHKPTYRFKSYLEILKHGARSPGEGAINSEGAIS